MVDDITIPDFLNRKLNPLPVCSLEERRAAFPEAKEQFDARAAELAERKRQEEEEKRQRARERIEQMKQRLAQRLDGKAVGWRSIPPAHLAWDAKHLRFYDMRVRAAKKLAAARKRLGLEGGAA